LAGLFRASCPPPFGPSVKNTDVKICSMQIFRTCECQVPIIINMAGALPHGS
jgi:hypothetical protein